MSKLRFLHARMTKCDSGLTLNPLMHVFILLTLIFSLAFLFFGNTMTVQASILYMQTLAVTQGFLNLWGVIGIISVTMHLLGLYIRGRVGIAMMSVAFFGGFYMWLWAGTIYIMSGFFFQFLVGALPNLLFWLWYAWQWRRRKNNEHVAFV